MIKIDGLQGLECLTRANGCDPNLILDKRRIFDFLVNNKFMRTWKMFEYEGLPETTDPRTLEWGSQSQGFIIVKDVRNTEGYQIPHGKPEGWYALVGVGLGGEWDENYIPTKAVGANPYLRLTIDDELGDGVFVIWNDSKHMGLSPLMSFYGGMVAEAFMTLRLMLVLHRSPAFISASSEDEKKDALDFLKNLEDGKMGVIGTDDTLQNLLGGKSLDTHKLTGDSHNSLKEVLESVQYLLGKWDIALGLNDNYNMKRESLNSSETEANIDTLFPSIEDMLKCRQEGWDKFNKATGHNVKVKLAGAWARLLERVQMENRAKEAEIKTMEAQAKATEEAPAEETPTEEAPKEEETPKEEEKE